MAVATTAAQVTRTVQSSRDNLKAPVATGTGVISGSVVDQTSGAPIPRAAIAVSTAEGQSVTTVYSDAHGAFNAAKLAAGRYVIVATKAAYVRAPYGSRRYDRPATPITVADAQRVDNLKISMARGAVIAGTVTDDGQPIPDAVVRISQYRMVDGERVLSPVFQTGGPTNDTTDDRGAYRIYGLPAGDYVVSVAPRLMAGGDIRQMTAADIQSVRQAIQAAQATAANPGPKPPDPVTVTYASVFYPGTTDAANATLVSVGPGDERSGIDMTMQLVRTAHIDGIVLTPAGVPPSTVQLLLVNSAANAGGPSIISLNRVVPGPDGKFSYTGVAPGTYKISARATVQGSNGANANAGGGGRGALPPVAPVGPGAQGPTLWGQSDVTISGENISGVTISLQPGMTLNGRIAVDAVGVDAPDLTRARVTLAPATAANGIMVGIPQPTVDANGQFTMTGVVPGKYRLTASLSTPEANWVAKSAMFKGQDILDMPIEIAPNEDLTNAVVTFTNRTQEVSGHLQDASGRPATDYTIVLFPADRGAWSSTRRVRTSRPGTDGQFVIANVPAGNYRLAAVVDVAPGETSDPAFLEEVSAASLAITLGDGEKKVQDLRIR
jgi:5-hydroxyisourate hydrolase-like protein (transthyretin family)